MPYAKKYTEIYLLDGIGYHCALVLFEPLMTP